MEMESGTALLGFYTKLMHEWSKSFVLNPFKQCLVTKGV